MGYYTHYTLTISGADEATLPKIHEALRACEGACYAFGLEEDEDPRTSYDDEEASKWYEHEEDLRGISARFPGVLFKLEGEGEESGDIWARYFRDGKCQTAQAKIEVGEFDPAQLA